MEQHTQNAGNLAGALKGQDAPEALSTGEFPVQPAGKLTPREKRWIAYDVGNSAFVLLSTAVVPIYANSLLEAAGQDNIVSTWGYAQTVASLVIALLMPILGSIADVQGMKIKFFLGFFLTGVVMCLGMSLPLGWLAFLIVYVLATIGLNGSLTFYDSMLIDTTSNERMDKVSSHGYAWGYVGSTIPFIVCIAVIFGGPALLGLDTAACTRISFLITAVWWVAFTVPLLRSYRQVHYRTTADHTAEAVRGTFRELAGTFRRIAHDRSLLLFMIAFFFYIDAVNTVISMSTSYGTQLGIDSTQLVIALLVTQFVAFPCAILYGRLAGRFGAKRMIV
ncbi:MFS transporter, partial [Bifidobacterium pullorum]|uniref:MFS transporter n=1 Tax=Bifidobacterium pullorum TaxID=78448 RepID=UPI00307C0CC7